MSSNVLQVSGLCKRYPHFALENVSFSLQPGTITGFIGRNGAGKTTTLKSLLNLVHPDSGEIRFFGMDFCKDEFAIKQKIGYVSGGISYYPSKKLSTISGVNRRFYADWDEDVYRRCVSRFQLLEDKTPSQLSEGMKVKYALALALSHHAELLILDEPTSGLDPVSREDLLEVFLQLAQDEQVTILFSTHITSDLDKCADNILYIRSGKIIEDAPRDAFLAKYQVVQTAEKPDASVIGARESKSGWTGLIPTGAPAPAGAEILKTDLEAVMVHLEKEA
ncbi:MAG: ABC transporter ATP-binding protein [Oscillibacter sp.]|jgi:ABC-2 type transport system ATP-binding protein|nr:ABC transporter ATP-binding protein [Oscillibacter sp.]